MSGLRRFTDPFRGFRRAVYVVTAGRFVNVFGAGVVYPFATLYFVEAVGHLVLETRLSPAANGVGERTGA